MVNYSGRFADSVIPGWEMYYFPYKEVTNRIEQPGGWKDSEFSRYFLEKEAVAGKFAEGKIFELSQTFSYLEKSLESSEDVSTRLAALNEDIRKLCNFCFMNLLAVTKALHKYRKKQCLEITWYKDETSTLTSGFVAAQGLIHELSRLYAKRFAMSTKKWVPPPSFSRKTSKYLVTPSEVQDLELDIIKNLPILEVEGKEKCTKVLESYLSSVYLDNTELFCYHDCIRQNEGAFLIRIRWYGGEPDPDTQLPLMRTRLCYVEMKTHHEGISGESSTKERFPCLVELLPGFLQGTTSAEKVIEVMQLHGDISAKDSEAQLKLARIIQDRVLNHKLKPMIRTVYKRTAFQRSDSNAFRISLDCPMFLIKEDPGTPWEKIGKFVPRPLEKPFPYGVLEVKIADATQPQPEWLEGIIGSHTLVEKFSKFQQSMSTFYPQSCHIEPYWKEQLDMTQNNTESALFLPQPSYKQLLAHYAVEDAMGTSALLGAAGGLRKNLRSRPNSPTRSVDGSSACPSPAGVNILLPPSSSPVSFIEDQNRTEQRTPLAAFPAARSTSSPATTAGNNSSFADVNKKDSKSAAENTKSAKPTNFQRVKVEPKTYFANERTFIQWMSVSLLIGTISVGLMQAVDKTVGLILLCIGAMILLYALGVFCWRLKNIQNPSPTSTFHDAFGPWLLSLIVLIGLAVAAVLAYTAADEIAVTTTAAAARQCKFVQSQCPYPTLQGVPVYEVEQFRKSRNVKAILRDAVLCLQQIDSRFEKVNAELPIGVASPYNVSSFHYRHKYCVVNCTAQQLASCTQTCSTKSGNRKLSNCPCACITPTGGPDYDNDFSVRYDPWTQQLRVKARRGQPLPALSRALLCNYSWWLKDYPADFGHTVSADWDCQVYPSETGRVCQVHRTTAKSVCRELLEKEGDMKCEEEILARTLKLANVPLPVPFTLDTYNSFFETPFITKNSYAMMRTSCSEYYSTYRYDFAIAGADATLWLDAKYTSAEKMANLETPDQIDQQITVGGDSLTLQHVRMAQNLLESMTSVPDPDGDSKQIQAATNNNRLIASLASSGSILLVFLLAYGLWRGWLASF